MEGNGTRNSSGKLPEHPHRPMPSFEAMNNDGHLSEPYYVRVPGAGASASQDQELQGVPDVPGWKPEWVLFLKTKREMIVLGDDSEYVYKYTMSQITDLMHGEFGLETYPLTLHDLTDVWKTYIQPALTKDRNGKSRMYQSDLPEETNMPAGGSNGLPQSVNGYLYGTPNDNAGGMYRAAPPNADATVGNGQSSRHQDCYGAHNSGASSSREGPQAGYGASQQNSRCTNGPLPPLRSLPIWNLGRDGHTYRASSRIGSSSREHESARAAAGYGPSRNPAPSNTSAAAHDGVIHPQPRRYIPGRLPSPEEKRSWLREYE